MKPIASTLALAASVALAVGLIIVLAMHVPVTPPMTGTEAAAAQDPTIALPSIPTSDLARRVKMGEIKSIELVDQHAIVTTQDGQQQFIVNITPGTSLLDVLQRFSVTPEELVTVDYVVQDSSFGADLGRVFLIVLSLVLLGVSVVLYFSRGSSNQSTAFAKSAARLSTGNKQSGVRFADVAGVDEGVQELEEVVEFLKHPEKFSALGARIPRGVLLVGPPGSGKTLLARAVAGEAGVPFFSTPGSAFVEMCAGVGASRVRDLFALAKSKAPCIVFVDEIDAVGRQRGAGGGVNDEREQTLNQLLVEMDGFDSSTNVIVIGATNRPDVLDSALLRPGRFDRRVMLPAPDSAGRNAILQVHARGKPLDDSVDFPTLAGLTQGLSGAQLANLINESAILAVRGNKQTIGMPELEEAIDRVVAAPQRNTRERLGPVGARSEYSDKIAEVIDDEIRRLIDAASARAMSIIAEHRDLVVRLARELVHKESLDSSDLERIFRGELESRPELMHLPSHSQESAA